MISFMGDGDAPVRPAEERSYEAGAFAKGPLGRRAYRKLAAGSIPEDRSGAKSPGAPGGSLGPHLMESGTLTRPRPGTGWLARLRAVPVATWAKAGLALLVLGAALGFALLPTFPNYDSYYALLWGRDALHAKTPLFHVYRAPTEHPLAIAFGALLSIFGRSADRLLVAATIASFVGLAAGLYRLSRLTFTPVVGAIAVALLCTRFDFPFLAARGYVDIPYLALVVWAAVLEVERPRRGAPVLGLLAAAGLLRPEAWVISGLYFLWCARPASWPQRLRFAALAAIGPALWAGVDLTVTGDPLYSLHSTSGLADELGRAKGLSGVPGATASFLIRLDKVPVLIGAGAGLAAAVYLCPRRVVVPLALLVVGLGTFAMVGVAGLSVIDRLGGWSMLRRRSRLRRAWALGAVALLVYGVAFTATTLNPGHFDTELGFRGDSHRSLQALLSNRAVRAAFRCGPISVPNHKLIPDIRWLLGLGPRGVIARSEARALAGRGDQRLQRRLARGVAVYPTGTAVFRQAIVEPSDDPLDQVPAPEFDRIATTQYYAAYARC
jgi:hypothetical protein